MLQTEAFLGCRNTMMQSFALMLVSLEKGKINVIEKELAI